VVDTSKTRKGNKFIDKFISPILYAVNKALEYEIKDYERKTGKRILDERKTKDKD